MTTTRATLRARVVEFAFGDHYSLTTTSVGDPTSVIATGLANLLGGSDVDYFENWYVLITESGHSAVNESRRVSAYDGTSDLTVAQAFSATTGSSTDFELLPYDPTLIHDCINAAGRRVWPRIYLPILDSSLITDGLGTNMDFETWTTSPGAPDGWTADSGPTIETETSRVLFGTNSAKVTGGSADGGFYQDLTVNVADIVSSSLTFGGLMWSTTADAGWFQVDFGGSDTHNSTKHAGDEDWQHEYVSVNIPSTASQIRIRCVAEATSTPICYFDHLYCYISNYRIDRYALPSTFTEPPARISRERSRKNPLRQGYTLQNWWLEEDGETKYVRFGIDLSSGYRLKLEGRGKLTLPSSDTASMEVSDERVDVVAEFACAELFRRLAAGSGGQDRNELLGEAARHEQKAEYLLHQPGVRMIPPVTIRRRLVTV